MFSGPKTQALLLTLEVLSSSGQELVEDVEGALVFGLTDGPGLLQ